MRRVIDKLKIVAIVLMAAALAMPLPVVRDWSESVPAAMVTGALG